MGVSDLKNWEGKAKAAQNNNGARDSGQLSTPINTRPASQSGANDPKEQSSVSRLSKAALHPKTGAPQPPKHNANGGRMGTKSSQTGGPLSDKLGLTTGNGRLMSGGRAGTAGRENSSPTN